MYPLNWMNTGYEIPAGHKLRLAISTAYFPLIWPAPKNAELILDLASSYLTIPCHDRTATLLRDLGQGYVCQVKKTKKNKTRKTRAFNTDRFKKWSCDNQNQ